MDTTLRLYLAGWLLAVSWTVFWLIRQRQHLIIFRSAYWRWLTQPWRSLTFFISGGVITLGAPYTDDPTWDYIDGAFMSILAYTTAPWVVSVICRYYQALKTLGLKNPSIPVEYCTPTALAAISTGLFSASWSYDGYLLLRDGYYPHTAFPNLVVSSVLYLAAGIFWQLDTDRQGKIQLATFLPAWPDHEETPMPWSRFILYAFPFMVIASAIIMPFFW